MRRDALRERVLGDLDERRQELERQIGDLRAGRGKLVETYQLVERALAQATRLMAEEPSAPPDERRARRGRRTPTPTAVARRAAAPEARCAGRARGRRHRRRGRGAADARARCRRDAPDVGAAVREAALRAPEPEARPPATSGRRRDGSGRRRARAGRGHRDERAAAGAEQPADAQPDGARRQPDGSRDAASAERPARQRRASLTGDGADATNRRGDPDRALLAAATRRSRRSPTTCAPGEAGAPGRAERRARRSAPPAGQDRHRQGPAAALEDQLARWAHVLQPAVDAAYAAGAAASVRPTGVRTEPARPRPRRGRCSPSSPTTVVAPLREPARRARSSRSTPAPRPTPRSPIAQSLGARYREWRGAAPRDGARRRARRRRTPAGVYDAAPEGARLRWVPARGGQVPRLRRQRARADGEGQRLPDRAAAPARAPRLPLPARGRHRLSRRTATARPAADHRCPLGCAPMRVPTREPRRRFRFRGWIIGRGRRPRGAAVQPPRASPASTPTTSGSTRSGRAARGAACSRRKVAPALVFTVVFFVIMFVNLVIADRLAPKYRSMGPEDELIARYQQVAGPYTSGSASASRCSSR